MTNTATPEGALCLPAGRYEFKDMGIYIGEWLNERAVGLGLITKDKCQGEYTGLWDEGSEKSGVFLWPNAPGAMYEGEWAMNRRNGFGVFTREDWIIMGKFQDDFIVKGVKCKDQSIGKFEGCFENGFPSFGVETYADGGTYSGEYKNGVRQGLGVRRSIPYGDVINFFPEEAAIAAELAKKQIYQSGTASGQITRRGSLSSQRSGDAIDMDRTTDEEEPYGTQMKKMPKSLGAMLRLSTKYRCGFVLSSKKSDLLLKRMAKLDTKRSSRIDLFSMTRSRARSLSNILHPQGYKETSFRRHGSSSGRSTYSSNAGTLVNATESIFQLDEINAIDPETVEAYSGQWEGDYRQGYGICNRSDGICYEGQWMKNLRHGFGQTRFRDGTVESGRYINGKLVFLSWTKGTKPHMLLYNYHIQREVNAAVKKAQTFGDLAKNKANDAVNELEQIKEITDKAMKASQLAREYSLETRELVKEMYPEFEQPGVKYLQDMVRLMRVTKHGNSAFESALQSARDILSGIISGLYSSSDKKDKNENNVPPEVGLELPPKTITTKHMQKESTMLSRAGSYSSKRARKKAALLEARRREQEGFVEEEEEPKQADVIDLEPGGIRTETAVENIREAIRSRIAEAFMSKFLGSASPAKTENGVGTEDKSKIAQKSVKIPEIYMTRQSVSSSTDTDLGSEEDEDIRTNKSTSSGSYVTLTKVSDIKPQSDIPKIPLAKLFTNPALFNDHFDQYYGAVWDPVEERRTVYKQLRQKEKRGEILTKDGYKSHCRYPLGVAVTVNPQPLHIAGVMEYSEPKTRINKQMLQNMTSNEYLSADEASKLINKANNLPDGSIAPESLSPSNYAKMLSPVYNTNPTNDIHFRREWLPRRRTLPTLLTQEPIENVSRTPFKETPKTKQSHKLEKNKSQEETSDKIFHIVENGVKKRLHSTKNYNVSSNYDQYLYGRTNNFNEVLDDSLVIPTETSNVQIRSNYIVDSPQDEFPKLFYSFSESQTDINKEFNYMTSMPDVRVCTQLPEDVGITPLELVTLNQLSRYKEVQEFERKKEGEIVISLIDLVDWIQSNSYWISVLVFNMLLSYVFFDIISKST